MSHAPSDLHAKSRLARPRAPSTIGLRIWPSGQLLDGQRGHVTRSFAFLAILALAACGGPSQSAASATGSASAVRGGEVVASFRSDPPTFNRLMARDTSTNLVSLLTHGRLVRINQATQEVEPQLAESWTVSDDGRRVTMA